MKIKANIKHEIAEAVVFAAKSTEDTKGSIRTQLADCRAMAEREGWAVIDEGADENKSAFSGERGAELKRLKKVAAARSRETGLPVAFIVQHSDRISRAAGDEPGSPKALIETWHELRRQMVWIKSCEDDDDMRDSASVASIGKRNSDDSARKSEATKKGLDREVAERGRWRGGLLPEGYDVQYEVDDRGRPRVEDVEGKLLQIRNVVKHPDEEEKLDFIFDLYRQGRSYTSIVLELGRRGYTTRPRRKARKPVPYTVRRVQRIVTNPFYAGRQRWHGETFAGSWPTYIDPEDLSRLNAARRPERGDGRPAEVHLLSGIVRCSMCCGPVHCVSAPKPRKDGTRARRYICQNHRERKPDDPHWCPEEPIDAVMVDKKILTGLEDLLKDASAADLRESLLAGQRAEHEMLDGTIESARADQKVAQRAADRAESAYADALADDDEDAAAIAMRAAKAKRSEAKQAGTRLNAALDARKLEPAADPHAAISRLWDALGTKLAAAGGDAKAVNAALREGLECIWLSREGIVPIPAGDEMFRPVVAPSTRDSLHFAPIPLD